MAGDLPRIPFGPIAVSPRGRAWGFAIVVAVGCRGPAIHPEDRTTPPATAQSAVASSRPAPALEDGGLVEAGAAPTAAEPVLRRVAVGPAGAPVRDVCFVQGDCRGTSQLARSAFVEIEQGGGVSCDEGAAPSACPNLAGRSPRGEAAGFSPLCALSLPEASTLRAMVGGRPRDQARADLRKLVAKGAPCRGEPPGARLLHQSWCDTYRADGTLSERQYFGQIAGGGERMWFQDFDEHGKVTREFTDCDAGHH